VLGLVVARGGMAVVASAQYMPDIVKLLIAERDRLDRAIAILEGTRRPRGRPPGSGRKAVAVTKALERTRKPMSAAARKRISEAQKKRWAARRRAAKGG